MPEEQFLPPPPVSVAITGKLSIPREEAARLINASRNAQFVASVTYHTSYLVAALSDSQKARKAHKIGVEIIGEPQLFEFLKSGFFPPVKPHEYNRPAPSPFEVEWTAKYAVGRPVLLKYTDATGAYTERPAEIFAEGTSPAGNKYLNVLDAEGFKTFRADRVIEMTAINR